LLGQRRQREYDLARRGAAASPNAITVKIAINRLSRRGASLATKVDLIQTFK
jgi:hypothetical protein